MTSSAQHRLAGPPGSVVVTGATGFIGQRLVARLLEDGLRPRVLAFPGEALPTSWKDRVEVRRGDITDHISMRSTLKEATTVFHLAGLVTDWASKKRFERVNVHGTKNVLEASLQNSSRVVLASSLTAYGSALGAGPCFETTTLGPALGRYGASKQAQERLAGEFERQHGARVTIVRPGNVYGPGPAAWIAEIVKQLRRKRPLLVGTGRTDAGLVYVDHVVDILVRAAAHPGAVGRTYNASDDEGVTWLRFFTELGRAAGVSERPKSVPVWMAKAAALGCETTWVALQRRDRPAITRQAFELLSKDIQLPVRKAKRELGYRPMVTFADGMDQLRQHIRGQIGVHQNGGS